MASYDVNKKNNDLLITVNPGEVNNTAAPLNLVGQGVVNYGEYIAENFVFLTENFATAGPQPPTTSLKGQLWYNLTNTSINVVTNEDDEPGGLQWRQLLTTDSNGFNSTASPDTAPVTGEGNLKWFADLDQLYASDGNKWILVGPDSEIGSESGNYIQQIGTEYVVLEIANGDVIGAWASSPIPFSTLNQSPYTNLTIDLGADILTVNLAASFSNGMGAGFTFADTYQLIGYLSAPGGVINQDITLDTNGALTIPVGTTAERPSPSVVGMIRYNNSDNSFEGYDGSNWRGLGGVIDVDQDTFVNAESTPGADNDVLNFQAGGSQRLEIGSSSSTFYGDWNLGATASLEATYADIAERYHTSVNVEPGTVVRLGGTAEVEPTDKMFDTDVFGVVSENPAFKLNRDAGSDDSHPYIALTGRVHVKVLGKVKKGQRLVSSETQGVAEAIDLEQALSNGDFRAYAAAFGRALADKTTDGVELVEAVVGTK